MRDANLEDLAIALIVHLGAIKYDVEVLHEGLSKDPVVHVADLLSNYGQVANVIAIFVDFVLEVRLGRHLVDTLLLTVTDCKS